MTSSKSVIEVLGKPESANNLVALEGCNTCPNNYPLTFRDVPSYREYKISGICQDCQDEIFGVCLANEMLGGGK